MNQGPLLETPVFGLASYFLLLADDDYNRTMASPTPASPRFSEFYERKRRLSYYFAWASMALLMIQLSFGIVIELFSHPRPAVVDDGFTLFHRCVSGEETDGSCFLR